ncbi:hypothetical protein AAEO56_14565 [Flavobacterium sp. DGU11]|uniref:Uncharacterized protein n=1 Tax=Flavobacterium arundinis TaxID=3139143 RepID=A0ABU9HZA4_9FLAO
MKTRLLLLCLLFTVFQGCMFQSADIISNNDIDIKLRETIKAKNDSLIEAMSHGKLKIFKALGSENFVKHLQANVRNTSWAFRNGYLKNNYTVFDEYQCHHSVTNNNIAIPSEEHSYTFKYVNEVEDTYVSLLKIPYSEEGYLLAVIYGKEGDEWKIDEIKINIIWQHGKNAQEYYAIAKKKEDDGFLIDALLYAEAAQACIQATENFVEFDNAKSIPLYYNRLRGKVDAKYTFPILLENIRTKPQVMGISLAQSEDGTGALITYQTIIPVEENITLGQEFELVKKEMKKTFTDFDFNKPGIHYRAINQSGPDGSPEVHDFDEGR